MPRVSAASEGCRRFIVNISEHVGSGARRGMHRHGPLLSRAWCGGGRGGGVLVGLGREGRELRFAGGRAGDEPLTGAHAKSVRQRRAANRNPAPDVVADSSSSLADQRPMSKAVPVTSMRCTALRPPSSGRGRVHHAGLEQPRPEDDARAVAGDLRHPSLAARSEIELRPVREAHRKSRAGGGRRARVRRRRRAPRPGIPAAPPCAPEGPRRRQRAGEPGPRQATPGSASAGASSRRGPAARAPLRSGSSCVRPADAPRGRGPSRPLRSGRAARRGSWRLREVGASSGSKPPGGTPAARLGHASLGRGQRAVEHRRQLRELEAFDVAQHEHRAARVADAPSSIR